MEPSKPLLDPGNTNDLITLRVVLGYSQTQLAEVLGLKSYDLLSGAENGDHAVGIVTRKALLALLLLETRKYPGLIATLEKIDPDDYVDFLLNTVSNVRLPRFSHPTCNKCGSLYTSVSKVKGRAKPYVIHCEECGYVSRDIATKDAHRFYEIRQPKGADLYNRRLYRAD